MNSIGGVNGIGCPISSNQVGGEDFIRHIGNDKLIYNFKSGSGTTVKDRSREGNDGTLGAGAAAPTWKRNSLYFDGGDYVDCGDDASLNFTSTNFTLIGVFNFSAVDAEVYLFDRGSVNVDGYYLRLNANASLTFRMNKDSVPFTADAKTAASSIAALKQYHLTIVRKGNEGIMYIDGNNETDSSDSMFDPKTSARHFYIGVKNALNIAFFIGNISNIFCICSKALSQIEIQQEYLANKFSNN